MDRYELYPPMKTPRGYYVLYQPDYKTPNVFNLNERGLFKEHPYVTKEYGVRILVNEDLKIAIQYMKLIEKSITDEKTGQTYSYINLNGLIHLKEDLSLGKEKLSELDQDLSEEVIKVYEEWYRSLPLKEGRINMDELKNKLVSTVKSGKKAYYEWLIEKNSSWIKPYLPRMIHDFMYGLYERVADRLYEYYKKIGGEGTEEDLIKKINIFVRVYDGENLLKPDGTFWRSEDEIWDCWSAFAGSEKEAEVICKVLEDIVVPVRRELVEELGIQE